MKGFVLDTNVLSEARKPKPHGGVVAWYKTLRSDQVSVCALSMGEIQRGIERSRRSDPAKAEELEAWLEGTMKTLTILPVDGACFREWGRIVVGKPVQLEHDAVIAATARVHGLTVATRNVKDFALLEVPLYNPFEFR